MSKSQYILIGVFEDIALLQIVTHLLKILTAQVITEEAHTLHCMD